MKSLWRKLTIVLGLCLTVGFVFISSPVLKTAFVPAELSSRDKKNVVESVANTYRALHQTDQFNNGWTDEKNEKFLSYIRSRWLVAPSHGPLNISTKGKVDFSQHGQSAFVDKVLNRKRNGFFVECGAVDGVFLSNTLFFELQRSWTGLLIEPNPKYFQQILYTNRNAYAVKSCLSTGNSTQEVTFQPLETWEGVVGEMTDPHVDMLHKLPFYKTTNNITAQCFTLYSLLLAIGQKEVDYFSLDVEGPELKILQTIPFDKIKINVLSIEYSVLSYGSVVNEKPTLEKLQNIRKFFKSLGTYKEVGILPWGQHGNVHKEETKGIDIFLKRI